MSRVQSIAKSDSSEVPLQYIQPIHNRPILPQGDHQSANTYNHNDGDTIPVIDLSQPKQSAIQQIREACKRWGAFHVLNHGVPSNLLNDTIQAGLHFFEKSPMEQKLRYSCDPNSPFASQGYGSKMLASSDDASVLDWRDYFDHHTLPLSRRSPSQWPLDPPYYRDTISAYSDAISSLATHLLSLISEGLGLPPDGIGNSVGEFFQNITISYYPSCPQPDLTLGLQSHSDMGAISLLIQDHVPGLQIYRNSEWFTVHPLPDAILVLLSDQTEIITNGEYRSAEHRVVTNRESPRISVAAFHDPSKERIIFPAKILTMTSPARYRQVRYGDYVSSWYTKGPEGRRNLDALILQ